MNVVMHNMASDAAAEQSSKTRGGQSGQPGFAVGGIAYSTPEFDNTGKNAKLDEDEEPVALAQAAREPWTAGHGTKVVRGEPLTFSFHVAWLEGGASIGWPVRPALDSWLALQLRGRLCLACWRRRSAFGFVERPRGLCLAGRWVMWV